MRITIRYLAQLKHLAGTDHEVLELGDGATLGAALVRLASERTEEFRRIVLGGDGDAHPSLLVFLGDEQIARTAQRSLQEGDVVTLLTPMAGG